MKNQPGKIRRVTNASTVFFHGQSLNANLLKGLDLLSNLVEVILTLREQELDTNIEQMLKQI